MPDLATHVAVGYLASTAWPSFTRAGLALFLFGSILPDLATRPLYQFFPRLYWLFAPLHTPVGILLLCTVLTLLLEPKLRHTGFWAPLCGAMLHLALDSLQDRVVDVYGIFFPFAWKDVYLPLFWPDASLLAMPPVVVCALLLAWARNRRAARVRLNWKLETQRTPR